MSNPIVVDLSHWQPDPIDWAAMRKAGTQGVILKCTESVTYLDPTFHARQRAARSAGLFVASYHFLRPGNVVQQMDWYLSQLEPADGDRLVIDFEDPGSTFQDLLDAVGYLGDAAPACEVALYGSNHLNDVLHGAGSAAQGLAHTSLWAARYSSQQPEVPPPFKAWSLWQYTDQADCKGVGSVVDGNKWNGDPARLKDWFYAPAVQPQPEPEPRIDVAIDVPDGFVLYVNGVKISG